MTYLKNLKEKNYIYTADGSTTTEIIRGTWILATKKNKTKKNKKEKWLDLLSAAKKHNERVQKTKPFNEEKRSDLPTLSDQLLLSVPAHNDTITKLRRGELAEISFIV